MAMGFLSEMIAKHKAQALETAKEEELYRKLIDYACNNTAPPNTNHADMFMGWPLDHLISSASPNDRFAALMAIKKRVGPMRMHSIGDISGGMDAAPQAPPYKPSDTEMLAMRMRWDRGCGAGLRNVQIYRGEDVIHIFVVNKEDNACLLADDPNMFPSDNLITQLRILER